MNRKTLTALMAFLIMPVNLALGAETLYPSGYNIISGFELSAQDIAAGDTLVITRTIQNNETFPIDGLYFSDNLPSVFTLTEHTILLNDNVITHQFNNDILPPVIPGYITRDWVIDDPDGDPRNIIGPGDILVFEMKLICAVAGDYQMPFHAAAFAGNNSGFFSTDDPIAITVSGQVDTTPPSAIIDLEAAPDE